MRTDQISVQGHWTIEVRDPLGNIKARREAKNLIVNAGLNVIRTFLFRDLNPTDQGDGPSYIALGTDSTSVTATDTILGAESSRAVFANITDGGTGVVTVDATFTGLTATIAEAGIFTDASAGEMFNRVTFTGVALTSGDSFKATCALTFSAA